MAHFDKAELLDFIRHSVSLEDDIEQSNLIAQVTRQDIFIINDKRAKYGGLPLNFRNQNPPEEAWDDDGFYEPPPEPSSTSSLINDRLTARTSDMTQAAIRNTVLQSTSPISSFLAELRPLQPGCRKQDVTKLLKMQKSPLLAELSDYEQYEGGMDRPSKKILMIIAPNGKSDETTPQILVTVQSRALLYQLIGLAMFKYAQKTGIELRGHVSDYSLYVADETGEIDTDLPPLDGQTQLSRLGFNVLALVRTQNSNSPKRRTIVTAYLTDHTTYPLEIESMQSTTVKWLLDEVIKRIDEDEDERERQTGVQLLRIRDYTVERIDDNSQPFELTQSLTSCGVTDFLIVQKNSSRGDFMPHQGQFGRQMSSNSINLSLPRLPSFNLFEYFNGDSATPLSSPNRLEYSTSFLDPDDQVCSFIVTKMHRFKPNWKAYFVIRYSGFEINPFSAENMQNSGFFLQGKQVFNFS
ncbi:hypothetical protein WR25_04497 isoform C [Diploscapter pachys]|uniref:Uncharacterized protein n=1 Tax=Diploscapter pachys TaxID=2018661 RepID=A0A2A2LG39_9BILA|nr:hypothetical protein WR25_04497 isoform A [Diploscapter pachys]PAV85060.1 hypothetical protein WR25_04497 isoform C [Diploscapter pachys]